MTTPFRDEYAGEWDYRRQSDQLDRDDECRERRAEQRSEAAIAEMEGTCTH